MVGEEAGRGQPYCPRQARVESPRIPAPGLQGSWRAVPGVSTPHVTGLLQTRKAHPGENQEDRGGSRPLLREERKGRRVRRASLVLAEKLILLGSPRNATAPRKAPRSEQLIRVSRVGELYLHSVC